MPTREQAEQFETDGYFVADDAVEPGMFDELAAAARRVKHKVRSGQVDVYTHWATDENSEPWAIRGLLAPEFDEPVFAEYLTSRPVHGVCPCLHRGRPDHGLHPRLHQPPPRRLLDRLASRLGQAGARPRLRRGDGGAGQAAHDLALAPRHRRRREPADRARQPSTLPHPARTPLPDRDPSRRHPRTVEHQAQGRAGGLLVRRYHPPRAQPQGHRAADRVRWLERA